MTPKKMPPPPLASDGPQYAAPLSFNTLRLDDIFCVLAFFGMVLSVAIPPFRYLNYALPALALITILANQQAHFAPLARPYLLIVVAAIVFSPFASSEGAKDIYLILTGLSACLVGFRHQWSWKTVFVSCLFGSAILILLTIATKGTGAIAKFSFSFATSESTFESSFSYIFGLLAIWAAHMRNWKGFFLAMIMAMLTLKRIAIFAAMLCVLIQLLPRNVLVRLLSPPTMVIANIVFLLLALSYGSGVLDRVIFEYTGQSANQFGMGRQVLYNTILRDILDAPLTFAAIGMGPGDAYSVLTEGLKALKKENLHGDTLKILYEYGGIVLIAFIWLLYSSRKPGVLIIALYTNLLFLTDNTLIYPFYIYFATLVAAHLGGDFETNPKPS